MDWESKNRRKSAQDKLDSFSQRCCVKLKPKRKCCCCCCCHCKHRHHREE